MRLKSTCRRRVSHLCEFDWDLKTSQTGKTHGFFPCRWHHEHKGRKQQDTAAVPTPEEQSACSRLSQAEPSTSLKQERPEPPAVSKQLVKDKPRIWPNNSNIGARRKRPASSGGSSARQPCGASPRRRHRRSRLQYLGQPRQHVFAAPRGVARRAPPTPPARACAGPRARAWGTPLRCGGVTGDVVGCSNGTQGGVVDPERDIRGGPTALSSSLLVTQLRSTLRRGPLPAARCVCT
jgi:hypothetical protein